MAVHDFLSIILQLRVKKSSERSVLVIGTFTASMRQKCLGKVMVATQRLWLFCGFTVDLPRKSKSNIGPSERESNRIADSLNQPALCCTIFSL